MRAIGLAKLLPDFVKPDFIFASTSTKNSKRPYQTIHPTAKKVGLKVHTDYADKETKKFAKELKKKKYKGKTILVCWHHGRIPRLIEELGHKSPYKKWPVELFDRIIDIHMMPDFGSNPEHGSLQNLPQRLLFGDTGE